MLITTLLFALAAGAPEVDPGVADARKRLSEVLVAADAGKAPCSDLVTPSTRYLINHADLTLGDVKKNAKPFLAVARCAEKEKYFVLEADIAKMLRKADPKNAHPELLARALMGLGDTDTAMTVLGELLAKSPKDPDLNLTQAKGYCKQRQWKKCLDASNKTLALAEKLKNEAEKTAVSARAHKYNARASLHLGDLDTQELSTLLMDLNDGDKESVEQLQNALVPAKAFRLVVEPEYASHVALGVYHLVGKVDRLAPPVRLYVTNIGDDRQLRIEASIAGVTSTTTKTVPLRKGKDLVLDLTPPLLATFDPSTVRATRQANLELKLTIIGADGTEKVALQESHEISLEPRDFLPMSAAVDKEQRVKTYSYLAAWVTPNAKAIDAFLTDAKKNAPGHSFSGEQSATLPQVKALFEALKGKGVSYVMDPNVMSGMGFGQRTRLPTEVLTSTNAQCLEGTLLYASLLEAVGLEPAIVIIPGHAFVAWHAGPKDGVPPTNVYFLETTMTHGAEFDDAIKVAKKEFMQADGNDEATVLFVSELRHKGVTPQPFD